jgi:hypothetical protein
MTDTSAGRSPDSTPTEQMTSFATDVRPLFREGDRDFMAYYLDLWSYDDVVRDAQEILDRVEDGTMPCDEPWDQAKIETFKRWMELGFLP